MQNVVDDVSLRLTAVELAQTYTVVLLRLDSGALERKVVVVILNKILENPKPNAWCYFLSRTDKYT